MNQENSQQLLSFSHSGFTKPFLRELVIGGRTLVVWPGDLEQNLPTPHPGNTTYFTENVAMQDP